MSLGGRMLAINEGFGYRPILSVQSVVFVPQKDARPPSTYVYGIQLMFRNDVPTMFTGFLKDKFGTVLPWDQLRVLVNDTEEQIYTLWPKMPIAVVLEEQLRMIAAGKDPVKGYFVQFAGGPIRLFSQREWWKETEDDEE